MPPKKRDSLSPVTATGGSGPVSVDPTLPDVVARMPYADLLERRDVMKSRLSVIAIRDTAAAAASAAAGPAAAASSTRRGRPSKAKDKHNGGAGGTAKSAARPDAATSSSSEAAAAAAAQAEDQAHELNRPIVPYDPKTDVHWDFVMKEMMWLGADFQSERKAQMSTGKKVSLAVRQFHKSKETRRIREMAEFELKRRRLANRMARDVRSWWTKVERVISYKQKVNADAKRRKEMDKHLVFLVKQTERYGKSLAERHALEGDAAATTESDAASLVPDEHRSIEEALATADAYGGGQRRSKQVVRDYNRVTVDPSDSELYGTSTADDSDDYDLTDEEPLDDVTTLVEAERMGDRAEEQDEAKKLMEESEMDIEQVLERLREEASAAADQEDEEIDEKQPRRSSRGRSSRRSRREHFSSSVATSAAETSGIALRPRKAYTASGDGSDADDDADASDVEDFDAGGGDMSDGSDEFNADAAHGVVDDETTLEAEERLGRDMSYQEEIDLLNQEADMSVEQLRAMYSPQEAAAAAVAAVDEDENIALDEDGGDDASDGSEEFVGNARDGIIDDETTLEAEERLGRDMSAEDEINMLKNDAEMSVEELRAMYAGISEDGDAARDSADKEQAKTRAQEERAGGMGAPSVTRRSRRRSLASAERADDIIFGENDGEPEEEFEPQRIGEIDDETTLEAEERLGRDMSYQQEIDLLKRESEMSVDELRAMYDGMDDNAAGVSETDDGNVPSVPVAAALTGRHKRTLLESSKSPALSHDAFRDDDAGVEDEFLPEASAAVDDEDTLEAEERLGREMSPEYELSMLKQQSEVPIEELHAMYAAMGNGEGRESVDADAMSVDTKVVPSSSKRKRRRHDGDGHEMDDEPPGTDVDTDGTALTTKKARSSNEDTVDENVDILKAVEESEERARQTMVSRPFLLAPWVKLREYQQIGLNWLVSTQGRRLNSILADEMGLGKTLQTIALLSYLACYKGIWGPHLIIVPTSCLVNWESEIKRFCPGFKVLTYYGSAKRRKELRVGWTKSNWNHIVVTSYQLAVQDAFAFRRKKWYYLILDEAHNIKNFQSQRWQTLVSFNTQRRLLLTGTPLQNNLMELWSLLHFLMPHIFRSRKEFSYWFSNPMNNIIEGNSSRNDDIIGRLHGIIRPFVLRRLKKDVEKQMPGKYEHIVKCQLSRRQMFLYEEFMARSSTRVALKKGGNYMGMMNVLMQLRKVCNHPDLFEARTVVTPFFMEPLALSTAGCVINATESSQDRPSGHILHPLWSCGCGIPDFAAASAQDQLKSSALLALEVSSEQMLKKCKDGSIDEPTSAGVTPPGLARLLDQIWTAAKNERMETKKLQFRINSWRCNSPSFPFSDRLVKSVLLEPRIPEDDSISCLDPRRIASTPKELMAMRRTQQQRADELEEVVAKFVFCVPKAGSRQAKLVASKLDSASMSNEAQLTPLVTRPLESYYRPFRTAKARLTSFFPDKKLIQYDAGKLQTLSTLLYDLKRGGHRVLIFTQMSKMLDILEAFLNLHGHTYLRLDGATGVDKRQRLMDRFNNDTKVFCFILSTRSGGLGINLTGADTVVFYDSDWNPAMDAQAQDRAHRIGQTRDVHIYRLVTEHSIEENILVKAKQKRHLDFLVMDKGSFNASKPEDANNMEHDRITEADESNDSQPNVFTKDGLLGILGVENVEGTSHIVEDANHSAPEAAASEAVTKEQVEVAMASLEDEDDAIAMRNAQKEAAEEMKEFDESAQAEKVCEGDESPDEDEDTSNGEEKKSGESSSTNKKGLSSADEGKKRVALSASVKKRAPGKQKKDETTVSKAEEDMEKEFVEWQSRVGVDMAAINSSLRPTERYGLRFREDIDPFYSAHFFADLQRMQEASATVGEEWNVEEIEQAKEAEERRVLEEGDLLATLPAPEILPRQRYLYVREKTRLRADQKRRKLTGENWGVRTDEVSGRPFWFNNDTGEAIWDKPAVLLDLEAHELALQNKWAAFPVKCLVHIMDYLIPLPERMACSAVCHQWRAATNDISFVRHVLPVEMGALAMDENKMEHNHYRTIADALAVALPGDTIELGDGHYWVKEPGLKINVPLRFVGDEKDPSHVTIELSGTVVLDGANAWMEGISFRRPRIASGEIKSQEILRIINGGRFDMFNCVFDNEGCGGNVATLNGMSNGRWGQVQVCGGEKESFGLLVEGGSSVDLKKCRITHNHGGGIQGYHQASISMRNCYVNTNEGVGLLLKDKSQCNMEDTKLAGNRKGNKKLDDTSTCVEKGNDNGGKH